MKQIDVSLEDQTFGNRKFGALQAVLIFIGYYLLLSGTDLIVSVFARKVIVSYPDLDTINFQISMKLIASILSVLAVGIMVWSITKQYFKFPFRQVGFVKCSMKWNLVGLLLGVITSQIVVYFSYNEMGATDAQKASGFKDIEDAAIILKLIYLCVITLLGPFIEEFVFRGALYTGFYQSMGKVVASIIVTFLFVLVHKNIWQFGSEGLLGTLFVVSIGLVILREVSLSLVPSVLLHQAYNAGLFFN